MESLKQSLVSSWEDGFFYNLRNGKFDIDQYLQLKSAFEKFEDLSENDTIDKELVSLIWFIPLFVEWQRERLLKEGLNEEKITEVASFFYDQCEKILGLP